MCGSILKGVQDLPADAGFRQQTERLFGYIKQVCEDPSIVDDADVEAKASERRGPSVFGLGQAWASAAGPFTCRCCVPWPQIGRGQLEEVLVTARNHLALIPKVHAACVVQPAHVRWALAASHGDLPARAQMREMKPWEISDKPLEISYWEVDKPPPPPAPPGAPAPPK